MLLSSKRVNKTQSCYWSCHSLCWAILPYSNVRRRRKSSEGFLNYPASPRSVLPSRSRCPTSPPIDDCCCTYLPNSEGTVFDVHNVTYCFGLS
ncbi:hypothetical protein CY34DRAFT_252514 [Suillus luteus UH-Slu-Lm8-n1]|uniref:Uncharacterized protein n=1 Tax=Suillus luteus UH-Slu-Lm8-n1 TaxID=930992 RepID=A0A0D0AG31_9AGAM|nr:hypothetical protein CY34DRAFT_252514 [Suillus luteus UH-Slu-Lm8-n1]